MNSLNHNYYEFGPFLLNAGERLLLRDGQAITLTPKAFETLLLLVENGGHVLTKEEMLTRLWPDTFVEESNLTNNISLLRRVLGDDSESQQFIQTVPRHGYRFVAAVKSVQPGANKESRSVSFHIKSRFIILTATVAAISLIVGIGGWLIGARFSRPANAPLPFHERDWVLITNFENRTGEPLFDVTIERALERELSNSRFANVITPERAGDTLRLMRKPPETKIDAAVGREICLRDGGIRALITGRVDKLGTTYVMSVSLVDPFGDRIAAGTSEEAANQDSIWPAIRRLSNWIRENLGEELPSIRQSNQALEKVTTPSLRALQLYTQAMVLVNEASQSKAGAAEQILRQALTEDPEFASAHIMLAHMLRNQGKPAEGWGPPSQRALDLSERTSERERYFIEGSYYAMREQRDKAVSPYEALVQQYPDHFWGRNNLAWTYFALGRYQESLAQFAQAAELRPNDLRINRLAAWDFIQHDMNEARRVVARAAKAITPEMATAHPDEVVWIQLFLVHDFWVQGDMKSALNELDRWARTIDSREGAEREALTRNIGSGYLALGKLRAAEEVYQRLPKKDGERDEFLADTAYAAGDGEKFRKHISKLKPKLGNAYLLFRAGRTNEAEKILSERKRETTARTITFQVLLKTVEGEIASAQGRTTEAIAPLEEAVPLVRWNSSWHFFIGSGSLADAYERQGDLQKAIQVLEVASQAKSIAYENAGSTGHLWLKVQWRLSQLYRKLGHNQEAERVEAELLKILAYADEDHPILLQLKSQKAQSSL